MKHYIELTLIPNDDIGHHFLWEKLFQQVHLALVEHQNADGSSSIGIAFPGFNAEQHSLGRKLRIFAQSENQLAGLNMEQWLKRLTDYVHLSSIKPVPDKIKGYAIFQRLQLRSNIERLARRAAKRQGISFDQAMEERKHLHPQHSNALFIWVKSLSSEQRFRLFIEGKFTQTASMNEKLFSLYGLSRGGSLPHF